MVWVKRVDGLDGVGGGGGRVNGALLPPPNPPGLAALSHPCFFSLHFFPLHFFLLWLLAQAFNAGGFGGVAGGGTEIPVTQTMTDSVSKVTWSPTANHLAAGGWSGEVGQPSLPPAFVRVRPWSGAVGAGGGEGSSGWRAVCSPWTVRMHTSAPL
jgi:hypothetical protein